VAGFSTIAPANMFGFRCGMANLDTTLSALLWTVLARGMLGNFIAIPLAFLILITGSLSICIGSVSSWVGELFNYANLFFVRVLVSGMQLLERIPYGWVECDPVPMVVIVIWYVPLMLAVIVLWRSCKTKPEE